MGVLNLYKVNFPLADIELVSSAYIFPSVLLESY